MGSVFCEGMTGIPERATKQKADRKVIVEKMCTISETYLRPEEITAETKAMVRAVSRGIGKCLSSE